LGKKVKKKERYGKRKIKKKNTQKMKKLAEGKNNEIRAKSAGIN
jgi:hypothetical protein